MSAHPVLVVGNKRYSSWSLRAWLVLKHAGIDFEEVVIPLGTPETGDALFRYHFMKRVPVLATGSFNVLDSLAIAEWAAERAPHIWPSDPQLRAEARVHAATMHSDFADLRREAPMNLAHEWRRRELSEAARQDMLRIEVLWLWRAVATGELNRGSPFANQALFDGPFMFGAWSIADAFWAPIATRVRAYDIPVGPASSTYVDTLLADPHYQEWREGALAETFPSPLNDDD